MESLNTTTLDMTTTVTTVPSLELVLPTAVVVASSFSSSSPSASNTTTTSTTSVKTKSKKRHNHKKKRRHAPPTLCRTAHQRLIWTNELERRFLRALEIHGVDTAMPKAILESMNVPGLTRENVSSHLQKYRLRLARQNSSSSSSSSASSSTISTTIAPSTTPITTEAQPQQQEEQSPLEQQHTTLPQPEEQFQYVFATNSPTPEVSFEPSSPLIEFIKDSPEPQLEEEDLAFTGFYQADHEPEHMWLDPFSFPSTLSSYPSSSCSSSASFSWSPRNSFCCDRRASFSQLFSNQPLEL